MKTGTVFLVLGVSGVGKSTLISCILKKIPKLKFVPSYTSRSPREGEMDGQDYFFVTEKYFKKLIEQKALLELDQPYGTYFYGIPIDPIVQNITVGVSVIRTIATKGLEQVLKSEIAEHICSIFILPDKSFNIENKLLERDGKADKNRVAQVKHELDYAHKCDYQITSVEGHPEIACETLENIIKEHLIRR